MKAIVDKAVTDRMKPVIANIARDIAMKAYQSMDMAERSFTGNTWTGTAVGAYCNGAIFYRITTRDIGNMAKPVFHKLRSGKAKYLKPTYGYLYGTSSKEGRRVYPLKDTSGGYSEADAIAFLESYSAKGKFNIVAVNGSEYATYIQNTRDIDVLLSAYRYAKTLKPGKMQSSW